mgnify:CR=1 FL=1
MEVNWYCYSSALPVGGALRTISCPLELISIPELMDTSNHLTSHSIIGRGYMYSKHVTEFLMDKYSTPHRSKISMIFRGHQHSVDQGILFRLIKGEGVYPVWMESVKTHVLRDSPLCTGSCGSAEEEKEKEKEEEAGTDSKAEEEKRGRECNDQTHEEGAQVTSSSSSSGDSIKGMLSAHTLSALEAAMESKVPHVVLFDIDRDELQLYTLLSAPSSSLLFAVDNYVELLVYGRDRKYWRVQQVAVQCTPTIMGKH